MVHCRLSRSPHPCSFGAERIEWTNGSKGHFFLSWRLPPPLVRSLLTLLHAARTAAMTDDGSETRLVSCPSASNITGHQVKMRTSLTVMRGFFFVHSTKNKPFLEVQFTRKWSSLVPQKKKRFLLIGSIVVPQVPPPSVKLSVPLGVGFTSIPEGRLTVVKKNRALIFVMSILWWQFPNLKMSSKRAANCSSFCTHFSRNKNVITNCIFNPKINSHPQNQFTNWAV